MKNVYLSLLAVLLISSCATDKVVTDSWIQKRKYNKGFYISKAGKVEKAEPKERAQASNASSYTENIPVLSASVSSNTEQSIQTTTPAQKTKQGTKTSAKTVLSERTLQKLEKKIQKLEQKQQGNSENSSKSPLSELSTLLLVIIAILLPPLAVGLVTNWDTTKLLIGIILWLLFYLPGLIYALYLILS